MNIAKVCNSADFVNYVKPELEMVDLEIEGSLLLTASGNETEAKFNVGTQVGSYSRQAQSPAVRR